MMPSSSEVKTMGNVSQRYEENVELIRNAIGEHFSHWKLVDKYLKPLKSLLFILHKEGEDSLYLEFADELLGELVLTIPDLDECFSDWKSSKKRGVKFVRERTLWPEYLDDPENDYKKYL